MTNRGGIAARRRGSIAALLAAAAVLTLAACSNRDDDTATGSGGTPVAEEAAPAAENAVIPTSGATPAADDPAAPAAESTPAAAESGTPPVAENPAPAATNDTAASGTPAAAADGTPVAAAVPDGAVLESRQLADWYFVVLVDQSLITDPMQLEPIARSFCPGTGVCQVGLWYDSDLLPEALPVPGDQLRQQVFGFGRNDVGTEFALWNCNTFTELEADRSRCLPRALN